MKFLFGEDFEKIIDRVRLNLLYIGIFICLYYTVNDIQGRNSYENAPILVGCMFAYVIGLILSSKKFRKLSAYLFLISTQTFMTFLIYKSGGLNAPGAFWFTILPLIWTILVGFKGLLIGYAGIFITYIFFYINADVIMVPDHIISQNQFLFKARFENLLLFSSFIVVFIYFYTKVLHTSKLEIEKKTKEISTLLRILVHDVSTPLSVIIAYAELLQRKKEFDGKQMDRIVASSKKLHDIIISVKRLFAFSDGKINLDKEPLQLMDCIKAAIQNLDLDIQNKNIHIELDVRVTDAIAVLDKNVFINQVLVNVISNAIKFSHYGGTIFVNLYRNNKIFVIDIIDKGVGVPPEVLPHLFSTDVPTSREGTLGEKGTGFGLPIVKEILSHHGASIEVLSPPMNQARNTDKRGTQVQIQIPGT